MRFRQLENIAFYCLLFSVALEAGAQPCEKDSNFYSITYHGSDKNQIKVATPVSDNEVITLTRHSEFTDFVTKFTSQGQVIWSNEYIPDYPLDEWWQYPWYERTLIQGMATGRDSTCFVYGSTYEHGTTLNNAGPPTHQAGFMIHLDRFGNPITAKYLGNWLTDYAATSLIQLVNGNLVIYLRASFYPYTSKLLCLNAAGDYLWCTPLQTQELYQETTTINPIMKELSNGNIIIENEMRRDVDDTLIYPFLPPIIVPAPLYYFHFITVKASNGHVEQEYSYQCPPLAPTNVPTFIPSVKNITELPGGKLSLLADMYLPVDNVIFYTQKVYARRVVNLITNMEGGFLDHFFYRPQNRAAVLQNGIPTGNSGEQIVLAVDSASQQPLLFKIASNNQVVWTKSYTNMLSSPSLSGVFMEKRNNKGYFIFQTDPDLVDFHVSVTNALGKNPCTELPGPVMVTEDFPWPWAGDKIHLKTIDLDFDFRISPFKILKKSHPLGQQTNCQYQYTCCTDFIDSLHATNITICESGSYTLPDNTVVTEAGTYYTTLKTSRGCDSVLFYNIKVLKSPSHLQGSSDTCLNNSAVIKLRATPGYETYWWNNIPSDKPTAEVHAPGRYTVRVDNLCGSKTDTIIVFDYCDFPIWFPSAFTPNGDFLNDILWVPELNKNKLKRLTIFNRWGQIVFTTTRAGDGWNGTFKGIPQPSAVYVYYLEMEGLSGKKLDQRGTVTLIR